MSQRLPEWLKREIIDPEKTKSVRRILRENKLNTVCESARCPNKSECYKKNTATFMILGKNCTRSCRFCSVNSLSPEEINPQEPKMVASAVQKLGIQYAVITSVTRDDLPDGGAEHFARTIMEIRKLNTEIKIEILTPDFEGKKEAIDIVTAAKPDVINHNIETVKRLYPKVRPQALYERSLEFIRYVKSAAPDIFTKSGFMLGLGEKEDEVFQLIEDLKYCGCDIVTVGQYIQPSKKHLPVEKYYTPKEFESLKQQAISLGIKYPVFSPLARSSYKASEVLT